METHSTQSFVFSWGVNVVARAAYIVAVTAALLALRCEPVLPST